MKIRVLEEREYEVPEIIAEHARAVLEEGDIDSIDELVSDCERHGVNISIKTISAVEVK